MSVRSLAMVMAILVIPQGQAAAQEFRIWIDGGHAFVFSEKDKRVDVGAIARPAGKKPEHFNAHDMRFIVQAGNVVNIPNTSQGPVKTDKAGRKYWEMPGFDIDICPDGVCPSTSALVTSNETTVSDSCQLPASSGSNGLDNLAYLPSMDGLAKQTVIPGWKEKLASQLILRSGRLTIFGAEHCFEFRTAGNVVAKRPLAAGIQKVRYSDGFKKFVEVRFLDRKTHAIHHGFRVEPSGARLEMIAGSPGPFPRLKPGAEVHHFRQFYELLPAVAPKIRLFFTPPRAPRGMKVSPDSECPSLRFSVSD